ncbi:MAG TPA: V-type ATP synthase subunit E family protein [Streptosporangiaceae bacterium]|nr:V-type ATP synthase subunit E family protein [Streptosporangiaceae bacterium]
MKGDPLRPVRDALLAAARDEAGRLRRDAEQDTAAALAAADRQAGAIVSAARTAGRADGEAAAKIATARARREARTTVLAARSAAFDELRLRVRDAVRELRGDPCYPRLIENLSRLARAGAGADTVAVEHLAGGVEAWAPGTRVDLSVDALADRAVAELGVKVARLWEP